jgi:4-hydroxyphenylpyruvate dioxygenase
MEFEQTAPKQSERKLVGFENFVRHNPKSDRFEILKFDHLEFWCQDATNFSRRFTWGLGMREVANSNLSTGNKHYALSVLQSQNITFAFTAPYLNPNDHEGSRFPHPVYDQEQAHQFIKVHGLAVRAIGIRVSDATAAYEQCVANGGFGVLAPVTLVDEATGTDLTISEVRSVDDTVFRWISGSYIGPFLPNCNLVASPDINYGLDRIDHIVTNVPVLFDVVDHLMGVIGLHEFAEFTAADVGTLNSGLNSMVGFILCSGPVCCYVLS